MWNIQKENSKEKILEKQVLGNFVLDIFHLKMKLVNIFVRFLYLSSVCGLIHIYNLENDDIEAAFAAISSFCEEFFIKKSINFDVILFGYPSDATDSIMARIVQKYPVKSVRITPSSSWDYLLTKSSVVLLNDLIDLDQFNVNIELRRDKNEELTFLIYLDEKTTEDFETSCASSENVIKANFYYLSNMETTLRLEVPLLFSSLSCMESVFKHANVFIKNGRRWELKIKSQQKFQTMFGCPLIFAQFYSKFLYFDSLSKQLLNKNTLSIDKRIDLLKNLSLTSKFRGFVVDMAEILSEIMNFKPQYKLFDIKFNSRYDLHFEIIMDNSVSKKSTNRLSSHVTDNSVILVIKNINHVKYDLFLQPFDLMTWIAALATLGVAFVVFFYMNWRLGTVRICPRKELTRPALNVLQIVFGCQQKKLPRANFTRFLLILFIMFCFVLRICYWSRLVRFMATEVKKVEPRTVEDLINGNYTLYSCNSRFERNKIQL